MFGKILVGALIGVGAVAAAPFTGGGSLIGAATLASSLAGAGALAAGAGAVGAAVGAAVSNSDEEARKKEKENYAQTARNDEKSKATLEKDKLERELQNMLQNVSNREQFTVVCFALGYATANADGHICQDEIDELNFVINGVKSTGFLPTKSIELIEDMSVNPPNLISVFNMIVDHGFNTPKHTKIFGQIIEMTISADGQLDTQETKFLKAWNTLVAA